MRYEVTAHIYDDDEAILLKTVRFELDADSIVLAQDAAEVRLEHDYPGKGTEAEVKLCQ